MSVHQQEPPLLDTPALSDGEGTADVRLALLQAEAALRSGLGLSRQDEGVQRNTPGAAYFPAQEHRLIEATPTQPAWMQRHRDDELRAGRLKPRPAVLGHEPAEGWPEGRLSAVLEPMNDLP